MEPSQSHQTAPPKRTIAALIVAAGSGSRMGGAVDMPKQFLMLGDKPVLLHSFNSFASHPDVETIIIVTSKAHIDHVISTVADVGFSNINVKNIKDPAIKGPHISIVEGGATRQDSVRAGLNALANCDADLVAIHDAARPLLDHRMIDQLAAAITADIHTDIQTYVQNGPHPGARAALPVLPVVDTIKTTDGKVVTGTIDRSNAAAAQTPQMFVLADIRALHEGHANGELNASGNAGTGFTDDISMVEATGCHIAGVQGSQRLMKITRDTDLIMLRALLSTDTNHPVTDQKTGQTMTDVPPISATTPLTTPDIRVGNGYDVHKFSDDAPGPIMLAGISVESDRGMTAHSDGDVGLHALCDAIFGALADGDIGSHFPPSDPQWRGADSAQFLHYAVQRCALRDALILHLDLTIICEYPKITPHRDAMRNRIAEITGINVDRIGVKATTSESLGFTGRREGIAAQATATLNFTTENPSKSPKDGSS